MSEWAEWDSARVWLRSHTRGEKGCSQSLHAICVWSLHDFLDFLRDLSPARAQAGFLPGARMDPAGLFHATDFAHHPSGGNCALDPGDAAPRMAREIRQTSAHRALDAAAVVLRVGDRSDYLLYGVSDLCAQVRSSGRCRPREKSVKTGCDRPGGTLAGLMPPSAESARPAACRTWERRCARN